MTKTDQQNASQATVDCTPDHQNPFVITHNRGCTWPLTRTPRPDFAKNLEQWLSLEGPILWCDGILEITLIEPWPSLRCLYISMHHAPLTSWTLLYQYEHNSLAHTHTHTHIGTRRSQSALWWSCDRKSQAGHLVNKHHPFAIPITHQSVHPAFT